MKEDSIRLRKALLSDAYLLYHWAKDKEVRQNSFSGRDFSKKEHMQWFKEKMNSSTSYIYILLKNEMPIGQIRIDIDGDVGIISYSIDSQYRGKGYGKQMLRLLESEMSGWIHKVSYLKGYVKEENIASKTVFLRSGYLEIEDGIYFKKI